MTAVSLRDASVVAVALLTLAGCSSSSRPAANGASTSLPSVSLKTVPDTPGGLREVAQAYARAYLVGTISDINEAAGPSCASTPSQPNKQAEAGLEQLRAGITRETGVAANSIKIRGAAVRNYTPSSADAEVQYDLPIAKAGNDNWISYKFGAGRWQVADCTLLPIGGSSSSATFTAPSSR